MNWSAKHWLAPRHIETPDVAADISKYLDDGFSQATFDNLDAKKRDKLIVLAERLELIDHISTLSGYIHKRNRVQEIEASRRDGIAKVTYSAMIDGHNFAGFDFDSDALITYLLLTCIDTIKGKQNYLDPFKWLKKKQPEGDFDLSALAREYKQAHGLGRLFKEAFTLDCSPCFQKLVIENFAVVRIANREVTTESAEAWEKRSDAKRVDCIADHLYSIRSKFTHLSSRAFSPDVPVYKSLDSIDRVLIRRAGGPELRTVLIEIVKHLAVELLMR